MRVRTQYIITLAVFSVLLIVIGAFTVIESQQISKTRAQISLANNIVKGASDLSYLSSDYVVYRGNQQISQWQTRYASFSSDISKLTADTLEQQTLIQNIQATQQSVKTVFDSIVSTRGTAQNQNETLSSLQVSWSRMTIQSQSLVSDATLLENLFAAQADQLNFINFALIFTAAVIFSVFLVVIYVQTFRRTLKSLSELQVGVAVVGSGDLDFKFKENRKDEIGELSSAFNQMTANLKTATASKNDLQNEIDERKKAEEALVKRTEELEDTQFKLEEKSVLVEEYANQMEMLAEQRLTQLKDSERLAAIGATAGMVGHDIRNPLQAITGDLFLAKSELAAFPESEEKKNILESLDESEKNVDYINKIVQDLQDYARPLNPKSEATDLKQLVEKLFIKNGLPKKIKVSVKVAEDAKVVSADSYYINRIMYNLVTNAVQAMPNGGKLTIQAYKEAGDTVLSVQDTGVGIPMEIQSKLFTVMFTTKSKGQGFGLPVVKRMTESLGGTVSFESEEEKGTTFIVRLPPQKAKQ